MYSFIYCITDPSIEMNPGPSPKTFKSFPHDSEKEKQLFRKIRNINMEINAIQSHTHRRFLIKCRDNNVMPRGLKTKNKFSLPTKNADNFIKSTLSQTEDKNIDQKIEATIQHFDKELFELILQKQSLMSDLEGFSTVERFQFLSRALRGFSIKEKSDLDSGKAKKLNNLIRQKTNSSLINNQTSDPWISHLNLSSVEKNFILNNEDLCDRSL